MMCYAKPGPRCSGHAREALGKTYADTRKVGAGIKEFLAHEEAKVDFFTTRAGIRKLEHEANMASTPDERQQINTMIGVYKERRSLALESYRASTLGGASVDKTEWDRLENQSERSGYHQTDIPAPVSAYAPVEAPRLYSEDAMGVRSTADKYNPEISSYLGKDGTFGITNGDYNATYGASREVVLPDYEVDRIRGLAELGSRVEGDEIEIETDDPDVMVMVEVSGDKMGFSIVEAGDSYNGHSGQGIDIPLDAVIQMFEARNDS